MKKKFQSSGKTLFIHITINIQKTFIHHTWGYFLAVVVKWYTNAQGASWDGETLTLTRLVQNVAIKTEDGQYIDLPFEEIPWGYFTLQDAVDFARYAVEATIQTMHFKNVIETVGGAVDILVITPDETKWLQKEYLK